MSPDSKPARWKVVLGYAAFAVVAFILCLLFTFPYDAVRSRVVTEAAGQGLAVRIGSLRPGLYGITAHDVRLSKPPAPLSPDTVASLARGESTVLGAAELGEALVFDSVAMRPTLFPPGLAVNASAMGGSLFLSVGGLSDLAVRLEARGLKANGGNLPAYTGLDMEGNVSGNLALNMPGSVFKIASADWSAATGTLTLDTKGLLIKSGKVAIPISPGSPAMPMDAPRIELGELNGDIQFDKGLGTVKTLTLKSDDLDGSGTGTVKLGKRPEYSELALDVRLKFDPDFQKRLGPLSIALNFLPTDRENPQYRGGKLTGMLSSVRFQPKR
ncbi:type II secretion system protein GspN [Corallococcus sp. H22C18031201]|uniref:type II secretion system protein GspN n=1 Tax=Citreicoccus inhibens TaxID=2849499 RepID=UPI000E754998|nr:type II secretion system protein GspN [Citreicoccus inhibens]MBU8894951.1 type II secretion system protein GspN [Citreicoccus inhibens]RJS27112.1 type II secretion system protein GspN [Corallococcus sp. H22C18031201]